jgi:hypothetical protein
MTQQRSGVVTAVAVRARVEHLRWRKGLGPLPEAERVVGCWMPERAPGWAVELAISGVPGSRRWGSWRLTQPG